MVKTRQDGIEQEVHENPRAPISQLDPFSPQAIAAPLTWDAQLLAEGPIVWLAQYKLWAVGGHAAVGEAMQSWKNFSSAERAFKNPNFSFPRSLVADDPPTHTVSRRVMNKLLSGPALNKLQQRITAAAARHVGACVARDSFDLVRDLIQPYILQVMGDSIGMKATDRDRLLPFGLLVQNTPGPFDETFMESFRQAEIAIEWVNVQCDRDALTPHGFGAEIYAAVDRGDISIEEAPNLLLAFLGAGIDTTVAAITNACRALLLHPETALRLQNDPALARAVFEESLRYDPPVRFATRVALQDMTLADAHIRQGDGMLLFFSAAARDPLRWPQPDRFDIDRNLVGHLTFGKGIHNCVGQMMARMEGVALISALAPHITSLSQESEPVVQRSNQLNTFSHMPMRKH